MAYRIGILRLGIWPRIPRREQMHGANNLASVDREYFRQSGERSASVWGDIASRRVHKDPSYSNPVVRADMGKTVLCT